MKANASIRPSLRAVRALAFAAVIAVLGPWTSFAAGEADDATALARALNLNPNRELPSVTVQHRELMEKVGKDVVCLCATCPKRLIKDCECGWARTMQMTLINALAEGHTHEELVTKYQEIYGAKGLAMIPDDDLFAKGAWALPYAGAIVGLLGVFFAGWRIRQRQPEDEAPTASDSGEDTPAEPVEDAARKELARELEDLD